MKLEGFAGNDDVRLRTLMTIPKNVVGRVIGKGGKNARDIEQMTGAIVRITEDQRAQEEEAMVEVYGNFAATQVRSTFYIDHFRVYLNFLRFFFQI